MVRLLLVPIAAIAGNLVGYWIGYKAGPAVFNKPDSRLFRQEYVDRSHDFFEQYGARTIVLARFVPIVRTFATVMAGAGRMRFRTYAIYSVIGGVLWGAGVLALGYCSGHIPFVRNTVEPLIEPILIARGAALDGAGRGRAAALPAPARRDELGPAAGRADRAGRDVEEAPAGHRWPAPHRLTRTRGTMGGMTERRPAECWLTDMDGVLVHEGVPVPGAQDFIQALEKSGKRYLVLTNNSIYTPRDLHARLRTSGIDVPRGRDLDLGAGHRAVPRLAAAGRHRVRRSARPG